MKKLRPALSLFQITFLGIGTMIGAGIYVLIGKIAGIAGPLSFWSFIAAATIVSFSAYSHGFLAKHIPSSAGAAEYVQTAFNHRIVTLAVGVGVLLTGVVSAATLANGFYGYFSEIFLLPDWLVITVVVSILCFIGCRPVNTSVNIAVAITLIEMVGLAIVIIFSEGTQENYQLPLPSISHRDFSLILAGAFVAFYAYVGFEDMVNLAEEVKQPDKNMLLAVMLALAVTTTLYLLTAWVAIRSMPIDELAASDAPFATMLSHIPWLSKAISVIGLIAIINGALVQILMGSRMLFGLSRQGHLPQFLSSLGAGKVPQNATLFVSALVLLFALWLPLLTLAKLTSAIVLTVFTLVNAAAFIIALRKQQRIPASLAGVGVLLSIFFMIAGTSSAH